VKRRRDGLSVAAIVLLVSGLIGQLANERLAGLSIDCLFWLRSRLFAAAYTPDQSPTVVVALDEETYRRPPFDLAPKALWTREIARVLDALVEGGAKVVGFDVIFSTTAESLTKDNDPAPLLPGFDRDFLRALNRASRYDKVVLSKVQHQEWPIHPFPAQIFAVGGERNIRSANLFRDSDEVIRRVSLTFESQDAKLGSRTDNSIPLELAARAVGQPPAKVPDGGLSLAGYRIPGSERDTMLINFEGGDAIPTYSFADLYECTKGNTGEFFQKQFKDKVVLIGAVVDLEDRQVTSKRFITAHEHVSAAPRCALPPMTGLFRADLVRDDIPGVYIQASAVNSLLRHDALREIPPWVNWTIIVLAACAAAVPAMTLSPLAAAGAVLVAIALWTALATSTFAYGLVLPLLTVPPAAGLALAALLGYRFAVTDRARRLLRSSFALYLAPAVIDRMVKAERLPELGGEIKTVTVLFSDLAGFTSLSEQLSAAALVELMNEYLTAMTDIIEAEGGFVGRYIGDAIDSVFGAPVDDAQHALHAVRAALACDRRLGELNREAAFGGHQLRARIGLNAGEALVGNIGSRKRFNYTVMGDTVNLASRLEGANKIYGTAILVSESVRQAAGDEIAWREIDRVRVVGRDTPVALFEPLGLASEIAAERRALAEAFAASLAAYRAGRFADAAAMFDVLAADDPPSRVVAARARQYAAVPPPEPWEAVTSLETK
jgi:adenylate cyclase